MEKNIERLKRGDITVFGDVLDFYDPKLYYIAISRVKDENIAREVVQDTFVNLYLNIKKLKKVKNFDAWIIKILINNCNKKYRKRKYTEISYEDINAEVFMADEKEIGNLIDDITFFDTIQFLNEQDRTIMSLYYKDEYTTKEIAKILGMNENTVRIRIKRARDNIKIKNEGDING